MPHQVGPPAKQYCHSIHAQADKQRWVLPRCKPGPKAAGGVGLTPQQVGYSTSRITVDCDCEGLSVRLTCCSDVAGAARGAQRLHAWRMVIKPADINSLLPLTVRPCKVVGSGPTTFC